MKPQRRGLYMMNRHKKTSINKLTFLIIGASVITTVLIGRLFYLQVIQNDYYQNLATANQSDYTEIPAERGEIIISDYHSDEEFLLATNTTLNLLFVDPTLVKDPQYVVDKIGPLIFDIEDERATDNERIEKLSRNLKPDITEEEKAALLKPLTDEELSAKFKQDFLTKISQKQRPQILLSSDLPSDKLNTLKSLGLSGIEIKDENVYAYPPQISNPKSVAARIADYVEIPVEKLARILKGENRYIVLRRKLSPDITDQIIKLFKQDKEKLLSGIGMKEESFRYYPEGSLGANIVGYVNNDNIGQYGIESTFNTKLAGQTGKFETKRDSIGRQITVGESLLQSAVDGDNIVLTIDRSVQMEIERLLDEGVREFRADNGQAIVMNPKTGEIIAMAHSPSFDPNDYGDVFRKVEISLTPDEIASLYPTKDKGIYYFYTNPATLAYYLVFEQKDEEGVTRYYRYANFVGAEVYHNKIVSWPYEPGSAFKPIAMSAAIDDGDVTPNTTYNDSGPVKVDYNKYTGEYDFEIKNVLGYFGLVDMKTVIAKSLNTGMTFVAKKIGPALFYNYLQKFGFLDRTDIEFDTENTGKIEYFADWSESELATHAFGQGLTITMMQLANAYSAIANGGILMQPYIIKEIRHADGTITTTDPHQVRRVISEDTSAKMTAMLVNAVENGESRQAGVPTHHLAAKTGTSQTYKRGIALTGVGTTIASIAGFAPIDDPKFVIIIKYDHPKSVEWGGSTAGVTFSKLATYLFDYYNVPPDK